MKTLTVGITAVGSGVGQTVLDSLHASALPLRIVGMDASVWAKGLYACDVGYRLPYATDPDYAAMLIARCREAGIDVLIPGSDPELLPLAELAPTLQALGCRTMVSGPECVRLCRDKLALYRYLAAAGAPFATTWTLEEARAQIQDLPYPAIVKPRHGSGSVGIQVICRPDEWEHILPGDDWIVQPYLIPATWHQRPGGVQPYLEAMARTRRPIQEDELILQVAISTTGQVLGRWASLNVLKGGMTVVMRPIDQDEVWAAGEQFVAVLLPLGLRGPCNIQGRITREGIRFFEANPRFSGSTYMRALLGYREVEALVRHFAFGEDAAALASYLQARPDLVGLRQMTETAVPLEHIQQLERTGAFLRASHEGMGAP